MKIFKNKLFYLYSLFIYIILLLVAFTLSTLYLEPGVKSFLISNISANKTASPDTIEIVVDDLSREVYPNWNSSMYTEILDFLHSYTNPKIVGLDFFKPNNDDKYLQLLQQMKNVVAIFVPKSELKQNEAEETFIKEFRAKYSLKINKDAEILRTKYTGVTEFSPANHLGSAVITVGDVSKEVLSASNLIKINEAYYPSLALKMYLVENNTNEVILTDKYIYVPKTKLYIPHLLPNNGHINTNIRFYVPRSYDDGKKIYMSDSAHETISAYKVIDTYRHLKKYGKLQDGDINPKGFDNATVFVGINQSGPYRDILATPMGDRHPGVDIQATIYDNLINADFLYHSSLIVNILLVIICSIISFIFIIQYRFIKSLVLLILVDILYTIIVCIAAYNGYVINYSGVLSSQLIALIFGYSFKFIIENRNKEKIKNAMGKYLSQDIMKNVVSNIDDLKLGGKRAIVTVLFSDIRGFTSMSEKMSAEEVSMILNEYFAEMEPIITKYNGVINKFIGDAVMAIFGEPIQDSNHAQNAVKCAYEMLKKVEYLREKWVFEGKPRFEIGVGINTGEVFIGNIGTENRMEYTVIGDTVNLASRIESYNKVYKTNLLVSSSTYSHIADIADVIKISEVQIRGKSKKMNIYEVLRIIR